MQYWYHILNRSTKVRVCVCCWVVVLFGVFLFLAERVWLVSPGTADEMHLFPLALITTV